MIYIANHPILIVCDSKKDTDMTEMELERIFLELKETLISYIEETTQFSPFSTEVLYTNLDSRLCGGQMIFSVAVKYLTELINFDLNMKCIQNLEAKEFLYKLKSTKSYEVLDRILELDTFMIEPGEYKDIEFYSEMNSYI